VAQVIPRSANDSLAGSHVFSSEYGPVIVVETQGNGKVA
jgi:hypothetical protein